MASRATTALAVGWMGLCGVLAVATMDGRIGREQIAHWLSFDLANRSSVHYKNSNVPYALLRPKTTGQIEGEAAAPVIPPRSYWI
jgi:hypothetical protein